MSKRRESIESLDSPRSRSSHRSRRPKQPRTPPLRRLGSESIRDSQSLKLANLLDGDYIIFHGTSSLDPTSVSSPFLRSRSSILSDSQANILESILSGRLGALQGEPSDLLEDEEDQDSGTPRKGITIEEYQSDTDGENTSNEEIDSAFISDREDSNESESDQTATLFDSLFRLIDDHLENEEEEEEEESEEIKPTKKSKRSKHTRNAEEEDFADAHITKTKRTSSTKTKKQTSSNKTSKKQKKHSTKDKQSNDPISITPFQKSVFDTVRLIPRGTVCPMSSFVSHVGCPASEAVGEVLKNNKFSSSVVPDHRIIMSNFTLGGYRGKCTIGMMRKKLRLLLKEGVSFIDTFKAQYDSDSENDDNFDYLLKDYENMDRDGVRDRLFSLELDAVDKSLFLFDEGED
ncbi:hypothetical protein BLNAU_6460 [Blattamonas nauphoetae]|uniref:methylated-DNA--[protein]-cysteine S-methyltransferase n=1 Tax=Blattamonas nauphoetae TaxID=2049346 RepID=A0ABQ9Y4M0_9EUKA|nr:hypothetical protein BLNAU_6460 [Blattamonas nauphoetae]